MTKPERERAMTEPQRSTMSHNFDSVMALCACGTRFWPRDKHDTKCYGCQTEERNAAMEAQRQT